MNIRQVFQSFVTLYHEKLDLNQRLYVNALVVLPFGLASLVLPFQDATRALLGIFTVYWLCAIAMDLLRAFSITYSSTLGKAVLLLAFSLCTNVAIALASQVVNGVVAIDPSKFPRTLALLSILTIPIFAIGAMALLYLALLLSSGFLLMFHSLPNDRFKATVFPWHTHKEVKPFLRLTRVVQLVSAAVFSGVVFSLAGKLSLPYERFLSETARSFIYHWEMYARANCSLQPGKRAAFISEERILVGSKEGTAITFTLLECKASAT